jgi:hypothetical protein
VASRCFAKNVSTASGGSKSLGFCHRLGRKKERKKTAGIVQSVQRLRDPGFGQGKRITSASKRRDLLQGAPSLLFTEYWGIFSGVKRRGNEVDCSTSTEVKSEWRYTSTPLICLHGVCRDNFDLLRG